ncbi:NAD-dependent epimerase/dehydratase [Nitrobacter winogradskyi Nb-255]|uniref:NAD-dependent epimerase/dehydratase n=1 Tax=Nitrobacter winogradskyi (strain ATCC 25391 / DSM 10237 / CIP 104748 / NCIMB 11846 / Nb-255) TaxID=323098 RepID=Q3SPY1_NITWN|nr:NAD-dependent 4,6-dehydratase LegB [Nitrobacter winogradskyi]ABA05660.1 NAD-dependent epimerase/dehydratase [Nitrobacter winogradskyi Nb-255]
MTSRKVLVTGAAGFIGSHLVEELVRRNLTVRAFVHYNSMGSRGWLDMSPRYIRDALDVFAGDIRDPNGVRDAMKGCDAVFHLAALIAIPYSYHSPDTYVDTNIRGTLNVVQAARDLGVAHVVHTSTSEVYGTAQFVPITEGHPLQGQSPYSASKIGADQIALSFERSFGTPVTVVRPFNTYGPRQSARAVIPAIITQIAGGARVIRLGSTEPTRDFSFVSDTVAGFIAADEQRAAIGEVVNLGSGFEVSIGNTAELIAEIMGVEIQIELDQSRQRPARSEVDRLFASNTKAQKLLSWTPQFAGLDGFRRGIEKTVPWFRDPVNLSRYRTSAYTL